MGAQSWSDDFLPHVFPGTSAVMDRFRDDIDRLNRYCLRFKGAIGCVLVTGETGVGKNFAVRGISAHSAWLTLTEDEKRELGYCDARGAIRLPATELVRHLLMKDHRPERSKAPVRVPRLATVLVPQLTGELFGSELFGHKKGSFTGASEPHDGIFGDSSVDDVFLDEIGDLSPELQAKLLQVVETRTFRPVGGQARDEGVSEHRIFVATNKVLEELVCEGRFREDLYWRVQGHRITIPPLRDRRDIVRELAESILCSVNQEQRGPRRTGPSLSPEEDRYCLLPPNEWEGGRPQAANWVEQFEPEDLEVLQRHDWPGNVRELRQCLELYVYHNGHRRLNRLVSDAVPRTGFRRGGDNAQGGVERAVMAYLRAVIEGREPPPGRPDALLRRFDRLVKRAVCDFRSAPRTIPADMQRVFDVAKDWQTTLSKWDRDCGAQTRPGDRED
jgi:DNA-binding NtrC family response regulator